MNRLLLSLVAAAAAVGGVAFWQADRLSSAGGDAKGAAAIGEKPTLALLTSLPIMFGERFGLDGGAGGLSAALAGDYELRSIAVTDAASLQPFHLLLMAHPRAQPAEALVDLDNWVRGGGRLLLLADPRLDWDSDRPIGDKLRPPPDFADTGLLAHWGLTLAGPSADGPVSVDADGLPIVVSSPGQLSARNRRCAIAAGGLIARCQVGEGDVTVIADADFINVSGAGALDGPTDRNLELVTRELARLAR
ncbi:hypothetical protein [Sphingomonas jaspsi]|uniref:hypothetical protein n=1 Tax=Sphingomonas jaspsi TaxID=392409 RepID=UPI0004B1EF8D|nr:hypothetical protein [Sphingomonas jaspsi]